MLLVGVEPAGAAFPGQNGKIVFSSNRAGGHFDSPYDIYTMNSDGTGEADSLATDIDRDFDPDWQPLQHEPVLPHRQLQP